MNRQPSRTWTAILLAALAPCLGTPCALGAAEGDATSRVVAAAHDASSDAAAQIDAMRVGFAGAYKTGLWTPLEVDFRGDPNLLKSAEVVVTVPDGEGVPSSYVAPAGNRGEDAADDAVVDRARASHARFIVRFGRVRSDVEVVLRRAGETLARRHFVAGAASADDEAERSRAAEAPSPRSATAKSAPMPLFPPALEGQKLIVILGDDTLGIDDAVLLQGLEATRRPVVAQLHSVAELPESWLAYEGVDTLAITTAECQVLAKLAPDDGRIVALLDWIRSGGRLLLLGGPSAAAYFGEQSALRPLAPGRVLRQFEARQTAELESYADNARAIPRGRGTVPLQATLLDDVRGRVEIGQGELRWVVRQGVGFGQVTFFAADLAAPPLQKWSGRPLLAARLLHLPTKRAGDEADRAPLMHAGYDDLVGQLRSSLDSWEGVRPIPFSIIALAIVVYLLVIGPLDYFMVRRAAGRPWLTWISFPLVVIVVCAAAVAAAYGSKGTSVRQQQIDLLDFDLEAGVSRTTSWMSLFSPAVEKYDLRALPSVAALQADTPPRANSMSSNAPVADRPAAVVAWLGLPGSGLGGMNPRGADPVTWAVGYRFGPSLQQIEGLPMAKWSSRMLTSRWLGKASAGLDAELSLESEVLTGMIVNRTGRRLHGCLLAYDRWAYDLKTLEPGGVVSLNPMSRRSELKTLLTGQRLVFEKRGTSDNIHQEGTLYDPQSTDPAYILRIMSFYPQAGGSRYAAGLSNDYQSFLEIGNALTTGRAVLLAELRDDDAEAAQTRWRRGEAPLAEVPSRGAVLVRVVIPVATKGS